MTSQAKLATAHGWTLLMHPLFELQLNALIGKVEALKIKHPDNYKAKNDTKRLAAIEVLVFDIIPQDPARPEYRQGATLGAQHKHWFRAKFFQQYRLFFRYHQASINPLGYALRPIAPNLRSCAHQRYVYFLRYRQLMLALSGCYTVQEIFKPQIFEIKS